MSFHSSSYEGIAGQGVDMMGGGDFEFGPEAEDGGNHDHADEAVSAVSAEQQVPEVQKPKRKIVIKK